MKKSLDYKYYLFVTVALNKRSARSPNDNQPIYRLINSQQKAQHNKKKVISIKFAFQEQ